MLDGPPEIPTVLLQSDEPTTGDVQTERVTALLAKYPNRRYVKLPSGGECLVRRGQGKDIERAALIVRMGESKQTSPLSVFFAMAAIKCIFCFDGSDSFTELAYEQVRELEDVDGWMLVGEVQKPSGKS